VGTATVMSRDDPSPLNALAAGLESTTALDGVAGRAAATVDRLAGNGGRKDLLSGRWLGHAVHPLLSDVPIGTWTSAVMLDWIGGQGSRGASDRLILAGLAGATATAATGWSDWADAQARSAAVRRCGLVHAAANGTSVVLMASSYVARKRGARRRGKLLALAGSAALGAGGWLGGHLSYTLGAGVGARG
jgi:uncharacterized membrane protein